MALRVVLGGKVGIERDGEKLEEAGRGRLARLALAYLVCERHRPVTRDELAEVLWGEELPASWDQMVRGVVSGLRGLLRNCGLPATQVLATAHGCYQFHLPADAVVDIEAAAESLMMAEALLGGGDAPAARRHSAETVAVASRQFVPGGTGPWVERRQNELRELHLRGLKVVAEAAQAAGDWPVAVAAAEEAIGIEPFRESAYVRLMSAHAGAGHRGEALRIYERCRRALAEELGVRPSARTEGVYMSLLGEEPSSSPVPEDAERLPLPPAVAAVPGNFLVGREGEVEALAAALKQAGSEGRHVVFVTGEPGIGKTALVADLARNAHAEGAHVLYGRCDEGLGLAYQPFAEAAGHLVAHCPLPLLVAHVAAHDGELTRLVPQLARRVPDAPAPATTDPEADRFRLFEAVADLLVAASQSAPVVLVLDDLHWAANATLLLLRHVLRAAGPAPLLVVATYRHTEVSPDHPLVGTLADLRREPAGVERIALEGLDEDAVAAFLEAAGGQKLDPDEQALARAIHAHTAGNPFFVGQLLRHLAESGAVYRREGRWSYYHDAEGLGVPEGVRDVVTRRLGRLSRAANAVLVLASIAGAEFDLGLLERLADAEDVTATLDHVEEAVAGHLVLEAGHGRYRFAHALVRETIYSALTATRRGRLHRRVGEALESMEIGDDNDRLPALAHHFAEAASDGCATKAADHALAAARQAVGQAAWEDAVARLERGLDALAEQDPPDLARRCDLLLLLAETWTRFYHPPRALTAAAPAVEAARALGDPERLAVAAYWYVRAQRGHRTREAEELHRDAAAIGEEAVAALGDRMPGVRAKILVLLAATEPAEDGEPVLREALSLARRSGDPDALGVVLSHCCGALRGSPRVHEFLALAEELVSSAPADGWDGWRNGHGMRAMGRLSSGDRLGFEEDLDACERFGTQRRFWYFRWNAALWRVTLALLDGRFAEVEALAAIARDVSPIWIGRELFLRQVFKLHLDRGDLAGARTAAVQLVDEWPGNPMHQAMLALADAERFGVDLDRLQFEALVDDGFGAIAPERRPVTLAYRAELAVALSGSERAGRVYDEFEPYRGQVVIGGLGDGCMGAVDRYLGMLAAEQRRWQQAEAHYDVAVGLETGLRSPPLLARTQCWYGRMLLGRREPGDVERAKQLLSTASETGARLGMDALAHETRRLHSGA